MKQKKTKKRVKKSQFPIDWVQEDQEMPEMWKLVENETPVMPVPKEPVVVEVPNFEFTQSKDLERILKANPQNLVSIEDTRLVAIAKKIDSNSKSLNAKLLESVVPLMLSYTSSTSYVKAVFEEGFKIELDFDQGLEDAIKYVAYLSVFSHFIRKSSIPKVIKKKYLSIVADRLADKTVVALIEGNKRLPGHVNELQAVVLKGSDRHARQQQQQQQQNTEHPRTRPAVIRKRS